MHLVEPLISGKRVALPAFFTTLPAPDEPGVDTSSAQPGLQAGLQPGLQPDDEAMGEIAAELQRLIFEPHAGDGGMQEMMCRWHALLAPGHA